MKLTCNQPNYINIHGCCNCLNSCHTAVVKYADLCWHAVGFPRLFYNLRAKLLTLQYFLNVPFINRINRQLKYNSNCIILYCIVLKGCSMLPNALRPFQIYCAPPNLGIRTWICRLNYAQRPIFSGLRLFTSLKSQTRDPQIKVPPGEIFTSWKNPSTSGGFEPANLGFRGEHATPRPPRPTNAYETHIHEFRKPLV